MKNEILKDLDTGKVVLLDELDTQDYEYWEHQRRGLAEEMDGKFTDGGVFELMRANLVPDIENLSDAELQRYHCLEDLVVRAAVDALRYQKVSTGIEYDGGDPYSNNVKWGQELSTKMEKAVEAIDTLLRFSENHNGHTRMAWLAADTDDHDLIQDMLSCPYNSVLVLLLKDYRDQLVDMKTKFARKTIKGGEVDRCSGDSRDRLTKGSYSRWVAHTLVAAKDKPDCYSKLLDDQDKMKVCDLFALRIARDPKTRIGPIDFGREISQGTRAQFKAAETGLLFQLTILFRRFTNGDALDLLENVEMPFAGQPQEVPKYGIPHWGISTKIIEVVFDWDTDNRWKEGKEDRLDKRLNKLIGDYPSAEFIGWPYRVDHIPERQFIDVNKPTIIPSQRLK